MEKACWKKTKDLENKVKALKEMWQLYGRPNDSQKVRHIITPFLLVLLKLCIPTLVIVNG